MSKMLGARSAVGKGCSVFVALLVSPGPAVRQKYEVTPLVAPALGAQWNWRTCERGIFIYIWRIGSFLAWLWIPI